MRMIDRIRRDLVTRLTLFIALGCYIPIIFICIYNYSQAKRRFRVNAESEMKANVSFNERYIDTWLADRLNCAVEFADFIGDRALNVNDDELRRYIGEFVENRSDYLEVFLLSPQDGRIAISSVPANEGKIRNHRSYFVKGLSGPHIEPMYFSPLLNDAAITLSMPVVSSSLDTIYVLATRLSIERLSRVIAFDLEENKLEHNYLVNRWNTFVLTENEHFSRRENFSAGIDRALESGKFTGVYRDWSGKLVIGHCRYIKKLTAVLVSEVEYKSVLKPLVMHSITTLLIVFIIIGAFVILFHFILKKALAPIKSISKAAQSAAFGDLTVRVESNYPDQIGVLASNFNRMVARLAENLGKLRTAEEKQRRLIDRANDGFLIIDRFGNIIDSNPSACRLWDFEEKELRNLAVFELFTKNDARIFGKHLRKLDDKEHAGLMELTAVRQNGEQFPAEISAISLGDDSYLAVVRDVEEKRNIEREIVQIQKLESIGTLAAGIAHDFDNILVGVLGAASLIKSNTDKSDPRYEMLEVIEASAERAAGLVKQLMTFSMQEPPHREPIEIDGIIEKVVRYLRAGANGDIALRTRISHMLPTIYADSVQIQQTLFNISLNAIDTMPDGGTLTIEAATVEVEENNAAKFSGIELGSYIEIAISDTGTGIADNDLRRIFEPFFSTKPKGKRSGLGLSISYGIIESHGGTILIDTELGIGSTFRVYLPAMPEGDVGHTVLAIIDRDAPIRRLYRIAFDRSDYRVVSFASFESAIEEFNRDGVKPSVIFIGSSLIIENPEEAFIKISSFGEGTKMIVLGALPNSIDEDMIDAVVEDPHNVREAMTILKSFSFDV